MLVTNYNIGQFLLFNITTRKANYTNSTGSEVTIALGRILGRVGSSGLLVPQVSSATDGSQTPIGLSAGTYVVPNGATQEITFVAAGEVNASFVGFGGSDTLLTDIVDNGTQLGTIGDILAGKGMFLKNETSVTYTDAQGS